MAHGEDRPGPHGGHIRMPGGFHTEVVLKDKTLEIYLIDIQFKDPMVGNSSVSAKHILSAGQEVLLTCRPGTNKFDCDLPRNFKNAGKILIQAKRGEMVGTTAVYQLPLKEWKTNSKKENSNDEHQHHH